VATNIGAYGDNRLFASTVGMVGYGGNKAEEAMYLPAFIDGTGEPLHGGRRYRIRFSGDNLPPVDAFWSVTLYDLPTNQLVENPIGRYAIGDRTPTLVRDSDGGVTVLVQKDRPPGAQAGNWLPAGDGPFWLILRMYVPKDSALGGKYTPPAIERRGG
jgi:hypothetical protein